MQGVTLRFGERGRNCKTAGGMPFFFLSRSLARHDTEDAPALCGEAGFYPFGFGAKGGRDRPSPRIVGFFQTASENERSPCPTLDTQAGEK
jgi:hypothetical protein